MSEKEWDLKDFEKPKSKDILSKSKKKRRDRTNGQINVYVGPENKKRIETIARQRGMSVSSFILNKLIQYDII